MQLLTPPKSSVQGDYLQPGEQSQHGKICCLVPCWQCTLAYNPVQVAQLWQFGQQSQRCQSQPGLITRCDECETLERAKQREQAYIARRKAADLHKLK